MMIALKPKSHLQIPVAQAKEGGARIQDECVAGIHVGAAAAICAHISKSLYRYWLPCSGEGRRFYLPLIEEPELGKLL